MTDLQRSVATATSRRDLVLFFATVRLPCHWRRCIIQSCGNMVVTVYPSIHSKALQHVSLQRIGKATWTASSIIFLQGCSLPISNPCLWSVSSQSKLWAIAELLADKRQQTAEEIFHSLWMRWPVRRNKSLNAKSRGKLDLYDNLLAEKNAAISGLRIDVTSLQTE